MSTTIQDLKIEIETKNSQTEEILEMKNLVKPTGTKEARFTKRIEKKESLALVIC